MCQFHMRQIVKRYLTLDPKLLAARGLKDLMSRLTVMGKEDFETAYAMWKEEWANTLNKRSEQKDGKRRYRHRRLRSAMHSVDFYLPYLFTCQSPECVGMPNTNNKIEGIFTDLKKADERARRHVGREPQAVRLRVFLGIGRKAKEKGSQRHIDTGCRL